MNYGLKKTPLDSRDLKHTKYFGSFDVSQLPKDYEVGKLPIKTQLDTDFCTGFSSSTVSEFQELIELSPEFIYAMSKKISGDGISQWGADLRTVCKVHTKIGAIEQKDAPYRVGEQTRDFLADYHNWQSLEASATLHQKKSYLRIDTGAYDTFDNIRVAMWLHKDDIDKKAVFCGVDWFSSMTVQGGLIPNRRMGANFGDGYPQGHAIALTGWKTINDIPYLIIHNSWSSGYGDNGYFYISRDTLNQVNYSYGAFMFYDETPDDIKQRIDLLTQAIFLLQQIYWIMKNKVGKMLGL